MGEGEVMTGRGAIEGRFFDGHSSRAHACTLFIEGERLRLEVPSHPEASRQSLSLRDLDPSGRSGIRVLRLASGAIVELPDDARLRALDLANPGSAPILHRVESSPRGIIIALVLTLAVLAGLWFWGIPAAARLIAQSIPPEWERTMGESAERSLDSWPFSATSLPEARQRELEQRFAALLAKADGAVPEHTRRDDAQREYKLLFRRFAMGPNAFAMPGGNIVLTDELVAAAKNDDAILGVLAHELSHVRRRHVLQGIVSSSMSAALFAWLTGDVGTIAAAIPGYLIDMSYSRGNEAEADDDAIAMLRSAGIRRTPLAELLESMEGRRSESRTTGRPPGSGPKPDSGPDARPDASSTSDSWFSSHPDTGNRARRLRESDAS